MGDCRNKNLYCVISKEPRLHINFDKGTKFKYTKVKDKICIMRKNFSIELSESDFENKFSII